MFNKYYDNQRIRDVCHGVKEFDRVAIKEMAEYFLNLNMVDKHSIIIPAPQHTGFAMYTKEIADIIAKATGAMIKDVLRCVPHEGLYEQKLKGKLVPPQMFLTEQIQGNNLLFLDNVKATGTTYETANKLFNGKLKLMVYATV